MMALSLAFVGEIVPPERTGRAMGVLGTLSAIGTATGPSLGGLLIAGFGWRPIFLVNIPMGLLTLGLVLRQLPADRTRPARGGLDPLGTLLLAASLGAYALAMTRERGAIGVLALLLVALVGAAAFALVEKKAASPLVPLELARDRDRVTGLATSAVVSAVLMSTLVVGPFYLARALGLPPALVGVVLSVGPLVAAASGLPAGRLADLLGAARTTRIGLAGIALGAAALAVLPARLGVPGYLAPIALLTASYALFQTSNNSLVLSGVEKDRRGVVAGLLSLARNLGLITGASVMGSVFALGVGHEGVATAPPEAIAAGMRLTFATSAALVIAALVAATSFGPRLRSRHGRPAPALAPGLRPGARGSRPGRSVQHGKSPAPTGRKARMLRMFDAPTAASSTPFVPVSRALAFAFACSRRSLVAASRSARADAPAGLRRVSR